MLLLCSVPRVQLQLQPQQRLLRVALGCYAAHLKIPQSSLTISRWSSSSSSSSSIRCSSINSSIDTPGVPTTVSDVATGARFCMSVQTAASALARGCLVAFPTETVYGLGARGLDQSSVLKIFAAKGRPRSSPVILHVHSKADADPLFSFSSAAARLVYQALATLVWPGPLTIIHHASSIVPEAVTAGTGMVGVRVPSHPVARQLLLTCGFPVAAPSANRFGHVSPTSAQHVLDDLHDKDVLILAEPVNDQVNNDRSSRSSSSSGGGSRSSSLTSSSCIANIGIESTVCIISDTNAAGEGAGVEVKVLRCGFVTSADLKGALFANGITNVDVTVVGDNNNSTTSTCDSDIASSDRDRVRVKDAVLLKASPGQVTKHYAPDKACFIVHREPRDSGGDGSSCDSGGDRFIQTYHHHHHHHMMTMMNRKDLETAFVLDVGGRLRQYKDLCARYEDVAVDGDPVAAFRLLYHTLRASESDLSTSTSTSESSTSLHRSEKKISVVLLPDLEVEGRTDERLRALWDRLSRAAAGMYVRIRMH